MTCNNVMLKAILLIACLWCGGRSACWAVETLSWQQVTSDAGFHIRDSAGNVVFDNKMWILGGWYNSSQPSLRDVWNSADGVHWTNVTSYVPFDCLEHPVALSYNNMMWVMSGGHDGRLPDAGYCNDVWSSSDGANWTQATAAAPWSQRIGAAGTVFNGKMWLLGGVQGFGSDSTNTPLSDVWNSTDGIHWTEVAANAPWAGRGFHQVVNYHDKLWVIGGGDYYKDASQCYGLDDVWSSSDGVDWTQATAEAPWGHRIWSQAIVYDDAMWVVAGSAAQATNGPEGAFLDDVWRSTDGVNWTEMEPTDGNSMWTARHAELLYNFDGKLWVVAGYDTGGVTNDVWAVSAPEPSSAMLLGAALLGLSGYMWRKQRTNGRRGRSRG